MSNYNNLSDHELYELAQDGLIMRDIYDMAQLDPVVHRALHAANRLDLNDKKTLIYIVLALVEARANLERALLEYLSVTPTTFTVIKKEND